MYTVSKQVGQPRQHRHDHKRLLIHHSCSALSAPLKNAIGSLVITTTSLYAFKYFGGTCLTQLPEIYTLVSAKPSTCRSDCECYTDTTSDTLGHHLPLQRYFGPCTFDHRSFTRHSDRPTRVLQEFVQHIPRRQHHRGQFQKRRPHPVGGLEKPRQLPTVFGRGIVKPCLRFG